MTKLSEHFTLEELTLSQEAMRRDIPNVPDDDALAALRETAHRMETVRLVLDAHAILVSSGFRCPRVNRLIGGVDTSAHVLGWAVDFTCPGFGSNYEVAQAIARSNIDFDQLIAEGGWVHISFERRMRRQILTAHFSAARPVRYTNGL